MASPAESLEAAVCRDLAVPVGRADADVVSACLGPAASNRFGAITTGRVGRPALLELLAWSGRILDANLNEPAPWRGPSRNARASGIAANAPWMGLAFAEAVKAGLGRSGAISSDDLVGMNRAVGGPGEWRTSPARVDGYPVQFTAQKARDLVERLLDRASRATEPTPLVAARLHLGLLLAHPFPDANGRTARLAAAAVLLAGGTKSSLQTCVEQHHHIAPQSYVVLMGRLRSGQISSDHVIDGLLGAMAGRCVLAAWVRHRQEALIALASRLDAGEPVSMVRCFEFGDCESRLNRHPDRRTEPWHRLRPHLCKEVADELHSQLVRADGDG